MELDAKQQVLVAIYTEYQKDVPNMREVKSDAVGLDFPVFCAALEKLDNEGFIRGARVIRALGGAQSVMMDSTMMTPYGIDYVENKLSINKTDSGAEKTREVVAKAAKFGYEELKDFAAKVLAELIKK